MYDIVHELYHVQTMSKQSQWIVSIRAEQAHLPYMTHVLPYGD
jgi:hypothetical protein